MECPNSNHHMLAWHRYHIVPADKVHDDPRSPDQRATFRSRKDAEDYLYLVGPKWAIREIPLDGIKVSAL